MRYIRGSVNKGIKYRNQTKHEDKFVGYVDSDFAGCLDSRKSISSCIFTLYGRAISWKSFEESNGFIHQ